MQVQKVFTFAYRAKLVMWATLAVLLGCGMAFLPRKMFSLLLWLLPWWCMLCGAYLCVGVWQKRRKKHPLWLWLLPGVILLALGGCLWWFIQWRSDALWLFFIWYLVFSSWQILRPVWARGVEKQLFWRYLGALTTLGFVLLLLMKPRSEFSMALTFLGYFMIAWGVFQLLMPSPRE